MTGDSLQPLFDIQSRNSGLDSQWGWLQPLTASPVLLGQVFGDPTVPTTIGKYYSVYPVDVSGSEAEGNPGMISVDRTRIFLVDVIGPAPAVAGDLLICRFLDYRWAAERASVGGQHTVGVTISGCPCSQISTTLSMHSSAPSSNNQIFQSATLQYGATPQDLLPVVIEQYSFLSTASFFDPIMGTSFYYFLTCLYSAYVLTRVYPISPFGSPFRDTIRYSWIPGFPGNSCVPFLMTNGQIYKGGDPTCVVTLSQ